MKPEDVVRQYLPQVMIMQLATASKDGQPWACNIHYYSDEDLNFYWISTADRRHSRDIAQNPKAAASILAYENAPSENYVVGISVEGTAELLGEQIDERIAKAYTAKHNKDPGLIQEIKSGDNPHRFYRLKPSRIVLFDSKNFPDDPRQELQLNQTT